MKLRLMPFDMYKQTITLLMIITCAGILPAQVIDYEIDSGFDTGDYFQKGTVTYIQSLNNEFIVTGSFVAFPEYAHGLTIIGNNGEINYDTYPHDIGQYKVLPYISDYITVGPLLFHRNQFGQTIQTFKFEYQKNVYSGFVSSDANDVMVYQDTLLLVAGVYFTDSTDISTNSLRQLCMVDATGAPVPDFPMVKCEPFDARIYTIDTLSTGEYIIAGSFTHVNGHPVNKIAKLNADFSVDTGFINVFTAEGGGAAAIIDENDKVWVRVNGYLNSNPQEMIYFIRLLPTGELDTSYNMLSFTSYFNESSPYENGPTNILLQEDGTYIITGNFVEVNGEYHKTIVQIYDDGTIVDGAFENLGADEAVWPGWTSPLGPIAGTWVSEIMKLPDGKLLLGGQFSSFGGEPYSCLVRLQASGYVGVEEFYRGTFKVFPNPADGFARVDYSFVAASQNTVLNIYTPLGRKVYSEQIGAVMEGQTVIDTRELTNGVYVLEIGQDGVRVEVEKLVVGR